MTTPFKEVKIGDQIWMAENLTIDDGGDGIHHHNGQTYYTWEAAKRVTENLKGWHLPSKEEWEALFTAVGGQSTAGEVLKSQTGWRSGGDGTDTFGFSALPAGFRNYDGAFGNDGNYAYFWSSTEYDSDDAYYMDLVYYYESAYLDFDSKDYGFSVRCIKD